MHIIFTHSLAEIKIISELQMVCTNTFLCISNMSCNIRTCPMAKLSNSYTWLHYILLLHSPCQIPFDVIFSLSIDLGEVFMILSSVASNI